MRMDPRAKNPPVPWHWLTSIRRLEGQKARDTLGDFGWQGPYAQGRGYILWRRFGVGYVVGCCALVGVILLILSFLSYRFIHTLISYGPYHHHPYMPPVILSSQRQE